MQRIPRELTFDAIRAGSGKTPGAATSVAGVFATGSPVGLIVGGGRGIYAEASGYSTVAGRARAPAKEIALELKKVFQGEGRIAR